MGQRLTVQFFYENEIVACLYQHWSAYTVCSYETVDMLIGNGQLPIPKNKEEAIILALDLMKNIPGAYLDFDCELEVVKREFKDSPNIIKAAKAFSCQDEHKDRSNGLIAIGKKANDMSNYGEYEVFIELDKQVVDFQVMCMYDDFDTMLEDYMGCGELCTAPPMLLGSKSWKNKENFTMVYYPFSKSQKVYKIAQTLFTTDYWWQDFDGVCYGIIA